MQALHQLQGLRAIVVRFDVLHYMGDPNALRRAERVAVFAVVLHQVFVAGRSQVGGSAIVKAGDAEPEFGFRPVEGLRG